MPGNSDVVVSNRPFEVGVRYAQLSILELINAQLRLLVGHIEQIGSEMERRPLTDFGYSRRGGLHIRLSAYGPEPHGLRTEPRHRSGKPDELSSC